MNRRIVFVIIALICLLSGCASPSADSRICTVIFEDNDQIRMSNRIFDVHPGESLSASVSIPAGYKISSVNYPGASISPRTALAGEWEEYRVTLPGIYYPVIIRIEIAPQYSAVYRINGKDYTVEESSERLRINTLPLPEALQSADSIAIGWRIQGSGDIIGFGSRYAFPIGSETVLEPVMLPCCDADNFEYCIREGGAVITKGSILQTAVIPAELGGYPVAGIAAGAFGDAECSTLVFPHTLRFIEKGAFKSLRVDELYLFDGLTEVCDASFGNLSALHLHINAMRPPVYCGGYFDTLSEKIDYLASVAEQKKIILLGGSSVRFGYDSALIESAFPGCRVVNMGVYAYSNMLPQIKLISQYLLPGDIVLSSPELDAIDEQFCSSNALSSEFFAMLESNYGMLSQLDCREFSGIFDAFGAYQHAREGMTTVSYSDIPARFDEDRHPAPALSYNRQGDYILFRESNLDGKLFGIKRAFYNPAHIRDEDWAGLNAVYDALLDMGVKVYFTWSPRSSRSISEDSNYDTIAALDAAVRSRLHVPVISDINASLMDALYFYGTDNHLSTEGADIHTRLVIEDLRRALEAGL